MSAAASNNRIKSTRLTAVGRYRLLATIGQGGMAEVFLASLDGPAQFSKLMAVKVLRPELADDPDGRQMFLEEARLAARLAHPNVIQTIEVGETDKTLYLVMEYLDGQPFSRLLQLSRAGGPKLPRAVAIRILIEALTGLEYAHELRDYDGKALSLVHRDVSPANIFVTYDGLVKVLDFGIAKAADGDAQTRAGVLKGKVGYLSPEQLSDARPDRRIDVYAAGVILWEALTGRRLWKGVPDMVALSKVSTEGVPSPATVDPSIPARLCEICLRATARNRDDRYPSAAAFAADLESYLESSSENANVRAVARHMTSAFADVRTETERLIERQVARAKELSVGTLDALVVESQNGNDLPPLPNAGQSGSGTGSVSAPQIATPSKKWPLIVGFVAALAAVAVIVVTQRGSATAPTATAATPSAPQNAANITIVSTPPTAMISLDGVMIGASPARRELAMGRHVVHVEAPGFTAYTEEINVDGDKNLAITLAATPAQQPAALPVVSTAHAAPKHAAHPVVAHPAKKGVTPAAAPPPPPVAQPATPPPAPTGAGANKKKIDEENPFAH